MYTPRRSIRKALIAMLGLALFASAGSAFADDDPPDRVARLSFLRGDVSFQPAGNDDWVQAGLNRPLGTGDRLHTDGDSRVEMEIGAATVRLDQQSSFDLSNLDDNIAQLQLTEGVLNLHVRRVFEGQSYEVDTPTLAFVVTQPGDYRVDIAPDGSSTMITVFRGDGDVYGENNASYSVRSGQSYRFHDAALKDYEVLDIPRGDDFDSWVDSRNNRYEKAVSRSYVSEDVIGYADLDDYGGWNDEPDYGPVWYPTRVEAGWAPYRYGHWSWIDPWGWTWVDNASWGFAPSHYGRWAYVGNRWGWCPGPRHVRPIYAPALVAFVGGGGFGVGIGVHGGGPVGWFPLGPREVYVPWYRTSRNYFTNVNVRNTTIVNNTYITNVYNNYSNGRPINNGNYAYRQNMAAVTAVSRETFVGSRPVGAARVQVNAATLRNANVVSRVGIAPERASFIGANAARARAPAAQALDRRVIARTAPPARSAPVAARIEAIKRNGEQPLARTQLRQIAPKQPAATAGNRAAPQRVQVVGGGAAKPQPLPARAPGNAARTAANPANRANPAERTQPVRGATTTPATAPNARAQPQQRDTTAKPARGQQPAATNDRTLPSSRFVPRNNAQPPAGDVARKGVTTPPASSPRQATTPNARSPANATRSTPSTAPSTTNRATPTPRTTPSENSVPRNRTVTPSNAPAERKAPVQTPRSQTQTPPVQRATPAPRAESNVPKQRAPQPQYQPRTAPQPQQRSAPAPAPQQQRSAPQPQPRSAPPAQPRSAPAPQRQQAPPPQERRAPPEKKNGDDRDKDKDGRSR